MIHPEIKKMMDQFDLTEQEAMFMTAVGLGIISGDVAEDGELEGEELDKAVLAALDAQRSQSNEGGTY